MEVKESLCKCCSDLCGADINCRVWVYQGKEYTVPPKAMIIEAILKEVYGGNDTKRAKQEVEQEYVMPENLKRFYAAMKEKTNRIKQRNGSNPKPARCECHSNDPQASSN